MCFFCGTAGEPVGDGACTPGKKASGAVAPEPGTAGARATGRGGGAVYAGGGASDTDLGEGALAAPCDVAEETGRWGKVVSLRAASSRDLQESNVMHKDPRSHPLTWATKGQSKTRMSRTTTALALQVDVGGRLHGQGFQKVISERKSSTLKPLTRGEALHCTAVCAISRPARLGMP